MSREAEGFEAAILAAWRANAKPWTRAVREASIESRRLVTDQAIIDAVAAGTPQLVLDIGCGEGWLARRLALLGMTVTGIDTVPALIDAANVAGGATFLRLDYDELAVARWPIRFDRAVCNFSLLGDGSTEAVLAALPSLLAENGEGLIQTLHPMADSTSAYRDGWREGSWAGCGEGFAEAAPWYFRTLAGWQAAFDRAGLRIAAIVEPLHPATGHPVSIIFRLKKK